MTDSTEINEFYKVLIENQNSTLQLVSFIILTITILLLGASFLWNFYFSNKKIKDAIDTHKKNLDEEYSKKIIEIENKLTVLITSEIDKKTTDLEFNNARIFAILTSENKLYDVSLAWWFTCLEKAIKSDNTKFTRVSINSIIEILEIKEFTEYDPNSLDTEECKNISMKISEFLHQEREKILKKIEKLKEKKLDE